MVAPEVAVAAVGVGGEVVGSGKAEDVEGGAGGRSEQVRGMGVAVRGKEGGGPQRERDAGREEEEGAGGQGAVAVMEREKGGIRGKEGGVERDGRVHWYWLQFLGL